MFLTQSNENKKRPKNNGSFTPFNPYFVYDKDIELLYDL